MQLNLNILNHFIFIAEGYYDVGQNLYIEYTTDKQFDVKVFLKKAFEFWFGEHVKCNMKKINQCDIA